MTKTISKTFDYTAVPTETKGKLQQFAIYFGKEREKQAKSIIEAGRIIADAHNELAKAGCDGKFSAWVEAECCCSRRSAYNYMAASQAFGNCATVAQFDDSALYILASDSAPEAAREEALKLAGKGEHIDKPKAKELVEKHTEEEPEELPPETVPPIPPAPELGPNCGHDETDEDGDCASCHEPAVSEETVSEECSHSAKLCCPTCKELYCERCHPDHEANCEQAQDAEIVELDRGICKEARNDLNRLIKRLRALGIYEKHQDGLMAIARDVA